MPGIGMEHGGAKRWINLGFITFQPAEFLKIAFTVYFAAWLSSLKSKVETLSWGLAPFLVLSAILGAILLSQPDTDTFAVTVFGGLSMYLVSGAKWRHVLAIIVAGVAVKTKTMDGLDSLLSIAQMPPGVPVATVAVNGAKNAGLLAVQMLGMNDKKLQKKMTDYKKKMNIEVKGKANKLQKIGHKKYLSI
jgi:hypothetical protein